MKKRKLRESLKGIPLEWPKSMPLEMMNQFEHLPSDTMVTIICKLEDLSTFSAQQSISLTRKATHQREMQWSILRGTMFVIKATLIFIQYLLGQGNVTPINMEYSAPLRHTPNTW